MIAEARKVDAIRYWESYEAANWSQCESRAHGVGDDQHTCRRRIIWPRQTDLGQ